MTETFPRFEPEMIKSGRWFVAVKTGKGPDSHIGDFDSEAAAQHWISTSTTESEGRRSLDLRIEYEEHSHRETGDWDGFPWSEGGPSAFYAVRRKSCQRDRARGSGGPV